MCGVVGRRGVGFRAVVCGCVSLGLWGMGLCPPLQKATSNLCLSPAVCNPPNTPEAPPPPPGSLPPPGVPKMVRPNKYACPVVCVFVCCALLATSIFASHSVIFRD